VGCQQLPARCKLLFHLTRQSRNKGMTHEAPPAVRLPLCDSRGGRRSDALDLTIEPIF
jgi:hypothetical protein